MCALMFYKIALLTECLITHITSISAFTTMCALMCCQSELLTESLITDITSIRAFTTICVLMCYKTFPLTECLNIQGVPGGKDLTSGECSLGQTIPI